MVNIYNHCLGHRIHRAVNPEHIHVTGCYIVDAILEKEYLHGKSHISIPFTFIITLCIAKGFNIRIVIYTYADANILFHRYLIGLADTAMGNC